MKRKNTCNWCNKTNELIPMVQGGIVHTICSKCNSTGPIIEFEKLRKSYIEILEALKSANDLCRSALSITKREGKNVNWRYFENKLEHSLNVQHKALKG